MLMEPLGKCPACPCVKTALSVIYIYNYIYSVSIMVSKKHSICCLINWVELSGASLFHGSVGHNKMFSLTIIWSKAIIYTFCVCVCVCARVRVCNMSYSCSECHNSTKLKTFLSHTYDTMFPRRFINWNLEIKYCLCLEYFYSKFWFQVLKINHS